MSETLMPAPARIGAIYYPDFELLDAFGPLEMFGTLGEKVLIIDIGPAPGPVRSAQGPAVHASHGWSDAPECDLLLVPGGVGTFAALRDEALLDLLRRQAGSARMIMSVCTGSALLARAGLLDGRRATTNKMFFDMVRGQSSAVRWVTAARWVVDDRFATSSGVSAGMDMALDVIARCWGVEAAEVVAAFTEYSWHRDADNDPFAAQLNAGLPVPESDDTPDSDG